MKRLIAIFVAIVMLAAILAGCGGAKDSGAVQTTAQDTAKATEAAATETEVKTLSGKIVFYTNRTDKADNTLTDLAKEFMAKNPGTEVAIEAPKDTEQVLKTRMASGEAPDISLILKDIKKSDYPKFFIPIDDLGFNKDNIYFYEAGLGTDGKGYGLIDTIMLNGIIYNKKVFADCGITAIPQTIDDFYAACEKIKEKGIVPLASNFKDKWPLYTFTQVDFPMANTGKADYFNGLAGTDDYLSEDGGVLQGLKILREMKEKGYLEKDLMSTSWEGSKKDFATGKSAMMYLGNWFPPQAIENGAKAEEIGMFPFPGIKGLNLTYGWFFGVSKDSKYPDPAKAFLKFAWENNGYQKATGVTTPFKGVESSEPWVAELLSYNLQVVEQVPISEEFNAIYQKAEYDYYYTLPQEYMVAKDPAEVVKKVNERWANARKK